jgi:hypothetical protein
MSIISIPINDFSVNSISFGYKINNNIIDNNYFYNITYSTVDYNIINIFTHIYIQDYTIETNKSDDPHIKKFFFKFKDEFNLKTIETIRQLEEHILKNANISKIPIYKLYRQFQKQYFNVFMTKHKYLHLNDESKEEEKQKRIYIKITGIWENETEYGLVYKLFISQH